MSDWADSLSITRNDGADLALVYRAAWARAITMDELSAWVLDLQVQRSDATCPAWLRKAPDDMTHPMEFHKALPFVPSAAEYDKDDTGAALDGLAWARGLQTGDPRLGELTPRGAALAALETRPDIPAQLARIVPQADLSAAAAQKG